MTAIAGATLALHANAEIIFPTYFTDDFKSNMELEGWTIYAPAGSPSGTYGQSMFPGYSPENAVRVKDIGDYMGVWTNSEYSSGIESDTWLISPEVEIDTDLALLTFNFSVTGINSSSAQSCYVYISEGGIDKENFQEIGNFKLRGAADQYVNGQFYESGRNLLNTSRVNFKVEGYEGKTVRIALVNKGNKRGIAGFSNIAILPWDVSSSAKPGKEYIQVDQNSTTASYSISINPVFPTEVDHIDIEFETKDGFKDTQTIPYQKAEEDNGTPITLNIKDVTLKSDYTEFSLKIQPSDESLLPYRINGVYYKAEPGYEPIYFVEDATGMWCGWCPFGSAALDYYTEHYSEEGSGVTLIPVAVHYGDVLQIDLKDNDYQTQFVKSLSVSGYPSMYINRNPRSISISGNPTRLGTEIEKLKDTETYTHAEITAINYDSDSGEVEVDYMVKSMIDTRYIPLKVSVLTVEDNVNGTDSRYNHTSYLQKNGYTADVIASQYGEEWLPYFEPYIGVGTASFTKITYQGVARGVYPSFEGEVLEGNSPTRPIFGTISFKMPETVLNPDNVRFVVLVTNPNDGTVIGADQRGIYEERTSGVEPTTIKEEITVSRTDGQISITTPSDGIAEVYSLDGIRIASASIKSGNNRVRLPEARGMYIVKVDTPTSSKVFKLF